MNLKVLIIFFIAVVAMGILMERGVLQCMVVTVETTTAGREGNPLLEKELEKERTKNQALLAQIEALTTGTGKKEQPESQVEQPELTETTTKTEEPQSEQLIVTKTKTTKKKKTSNKMCGVFFLHIRKAGGTFVGNVLREWLRNNQEHQCCGAFKTPGRLPCPQAPLFYRSDSYNNWTCPDFHFLEMNTMSTTRNCWTLTALSQ